MRLPFIAAGLFPVALMLIAVQPAPAAPPGWVLSHQKINDTEGGFAGVLDDWDFFGASVAALGDFDGDGVGDIVVGAAGDDDCTEFCDEVGALWILLLNPDGTVKSHQKISALEGGLDAPICYFSYFGLVTTLGDFDGDGVVDLAVAHHYPASIWLLFLNPDATVKAYTEVSGLGSIGWAIETLDDLDGNGVVELVVGQISDPGSGVARGAIQILFLNADGTVKSIQKISDTEGGFRGGLADYDHFGISLASLGDLNGDGVEDLAVGAIGDDNESGKDNPGAVWILFLNADGTVNSHQKIAHGAGGLAEKLDDGEQFGYSLDCVGDLDGDGVVDLAVGAINAGFDRDLEYVYPGGLWLLFLNTDGTVKAHQRINNTDGGFSNMLGDRDAFGFSVASLGDFNGDGGHYLAVGAIEDYDDDHAPGAVWILSIDDGSCPTDLNADQFIDSNDLAIVLGNWGPVPPNDPLADLNDDGTVGPADLAVILGEWGPCP